MFIFAARRELDLWNFIASFIVYISMSVIFSLGIFVHSKPIISDECVEDRKTIKKLLNESNVEEFDVVRPLDKDWEKIYISNLIENFISFYEQNFREKKLLVCFDGNKFLLLKDASPCIPLKLLKEEEDFCKVARKTLACSDLGVFPLNTCFFIDEITETATVKCGEYIVKDAHICSGELRGFTSKDSYLIATKDFICSPSLGRAFPIDECFPKK